MLEPAGSHGVWGLDDYHCLLFLWGSAQLSRQSQIKPSNIHDLSNLKEYSSTYIYLEGIDFIRRIKHGAPFAETSPMLNEISHVSDWAKICSGLMKLFEGEVMNKFPVIQHLLFGQVIKATWKQSTPSLSPSSSTAESWVNQLYDQQHHHHCNNIIDTTIHTYNLTLSNIYMVKLKSSLITKIVNNRRITMH